MTRPSATSGEGKLEARQRITCCAAFLFAGVCEFRGESLTPRSGAWPLGRSDGHPRVTDPAFAGSWLDEATGARPRVPSGVFSRRPSYIGIRSCRRRGVPARRHLGDRHLDQTRTMKRAAVRAFRVVAVDHQIGRWSTEIWRLPTATSSIAVTDVCCPLVRLLLRDGVTRGGVGLTEALNSAGSSVGPPPPPPPPPPLPRY